MADIKNLLFLIDQSFDHKAWHGTNLYGALRGVDAEAAAWRPAPDAHNIQEIVVHVAFWKMTVHQRLLGARARPFPYRGRDWFAASGGIDEKTWASDRKLLLDTHRALRSVIAHQPAGGLRRKIHGGRSTRLEMIVGIASHDLYHAGQIQLLKRRRRAKSTAR